MTSLGLYDMYKACEVSQLPQAPLLIKNDLQMALAIFVILEIHLLKGPALTNGFGGYSQCMIQSINLQ